MGGNRCFDDEATATAALYANSFRTIEPSIGATALRTHILRSDAVRRPQPSVAEEFLVGTRLRRRDVEFDVSVARHYSESAVAALALLGRETQRGTRQVALPPSEELRMSLGVAIRRRRSVRAYTGDQLPLAYLATVARAACGVTGELDGGDRAHGRVALRSTPSGGGLYPVDLHVAALRVSSLERGIYVYDAIADALWQTGDERDVDALLATVAAPDEIIQWSRAAAVCMLVGRPWRGMRKYGDRAMRHVFLEAGAIAEHINLAATALGIGSVDCSSIYDDEAHEALRLDGLYEALVHTVVLGIH